MRIVHNSVNVKMKKITAADNVFDDFGEAPGYEEDVALEEDAISDQLDAIEDNLEDVQDVVEDVEEDDVRIDVDNNITDHLVAECENCKGVFISAMIASDQDVDSISGVCPLCGKDTTQQLKWIIKKYPEED